MNEFDRINQLYTGEPDNTLSRDGITYDTSNVLAGIRRPNALADALRIAMAHVPENREHSMSLLNALRGSLNTAANWVEGRPEVGPDTLAPLGAAGLTSMGLNAVGAIPRNSLGIFGGRIAANRLADTGATGPRNALDLAEHMHAQGAPMSEIRRATNALIEREAPEFGGVHMGRDGRWRFEIDDSGLGVRPSADWKPATEHFPHAAFERAYPEARSIDSMITVGKGVTHPRAWVEDLGTPDASMMVRSQSADQARGIAAHEFQHAAQAVEGFDFGSSPAAVASSPLYLRFLEEVRQSPAFRNAAPPAQTAAEQELARRMYSYLAGEVEAQNATNRLSMSPAERRAIPPSETAPVPDRSQFLMRDLWPE